MIFGILSGNSIVSVDVVGTEVQVYEPLCGIICNLDRITPLLARAILPRIINHSSFTMRC